MQQHFLEDTNDHKKHQEQQTPTRPEDQEEPACSDGDGMDCSNESEDSQSPLEHHMVKDQPATNQSLIGDKSSSSQTVIGSGPRSNNPSLHDHFLLSQVGETIMSVSESQKSQLSFIVHPVESKSTTLICDCIIQVEAICFAVQH